jgi:DNA-binding response OmpR family regulator
LHTCDYDCVLLDLGLPDTTGQQLLRQIRFGREGRPVIVITARTHVRDRIEVLNLGADDYLTKPFDLLELEARLHAVMRRCDTQRPAQIELRHGPLVLCPASHTATWHDRAVPLTKKELFVLETLMRHKDQVVSRRQLEDALYGWDDEIDSNAVEVFIHHLRRKFDRDLIQTVRGVGYMLGAVH